MRPVLAVVTAAVLLLPAAPAAQARSIPKGPPGTAFYSTPKPLGGSTHGDVLRARPLRGGAAIGGAGASTLVLYRSDGVAGRPVPVSGVLTVPKGRAPKGGWPVVTYAHGTTGIADACAPSRDPGRGTTYANYVFPLLQRWLKAGWAVVRTDFEGLGTAGDHPYLVGRSAGRSTLDAVLAAAQIAPVDPRRVLVAGHSQGGHAALWAASLAPSYAPKLGIRGTVAYAPASHVGEQASLLDALTTPGGGLTGLAAMILHGLDTEKPGLGIPAALTPEAAALWPAIGRDCLARLGEADRFGGLAPSRLVRGDVDRAPIVAAADANDPETLTIRTPVRVVQGGADTTVFPAFTADLVRAYEALGMRVAGDVVPGASHASIVADAAASSTAWMRARLAR